MTRRTICLVVVSIGAACLVQCGEESPQLNCPELPLYDVQDAGALLHSLDAGDGATSADLWQLPKFQNAVALGCVTPPEPPPATRK